MAINEAYTEKTIERAEGIIGQKKPDSYVRDNVLHKYASYNYVFTLSALSRFELDNPNFIMTNPPHDIVARTGGIGNSRNFSNPDFTNDKIFTNTQKIKTTLSAQEILEKNRDIYFERVEIDSRPWFNQERKLMNFTKIEMNLSEPHGITLWQKIRAAAANNEFLNHQNAPFLLTIEWKGFDSKGVEVPDSTTVRKLPIYFTQSTMSVNAGGTVYSLTAVPWKDFAKTNAFLYTRGSGSIKGTGIQLQTYLTNFANSLNNNMKKETQETPGSPAIREYPDTYIITADPSIGGQKGTAEYEDYFTAIYFDSAGEGVFNDFGQSRLKGADYKAGQSIAKILEDFVKQFPEYSDLAALCEKYWKDVEGAQSYDDNQQMPTPWVPWFKIDTTVTVHPEFDRKLKSHRRTIHYHIRPFLIHVANFARAGLGGYDSWGKYTRKRYDYIYTGKNLDILDLDISYNSAYALAKIVDDGEATTRNSIADFFYKIKQWFGGSRFPEPNLPLQEFPSISSGSQDSIFKLENFAQTQQFYDFLTNPPGDMVSVEMRIMGDPAFIGQDCFLPMPTPPTSGTYLADQQIASIKGIEWDENLQSFNFDRTECNVRLNYIFPDDFEENTGLYKFNQGDTPQFSGLYRVNGVTSVFENGQFTQTLQMTRHLNQNNPSNVITEESKTKKPAESQYTEISPESA